MSKLTRLVLKKYWGYPSFRPFQEDIVDSAVSGRDTLALLPTGGGKSICFQVPAMSMEGVCIVVTPLIALMKDQVAHLVERGIQAAAVYSGLRNEEVEKIYDKTVAGEMKFLYVSPERLCTRRFIEAVKSMKVCLLAIDEAHCISQWGYDFRPPYLRIADLRQYLPATPVLALTATATAKVVEDIQYRLGFKQRNVFQSSFARPNVSYNVMHEADKMGKVRTYLERMGEGSAIVYVRSRRRTMVIAEWLVSVGISATFYHAGLDSRQRDERQDLWMRGVVKVMVATNAFGMGIDKPDVRLVLHLDLPDSLEAYFQEAGRAGRDLKESKAVLIVSHADVARLNENVRNSYPEPQQIQKVYQCLAAHFLLAKGTGEGMTFPFTIDTFAAQYGLPLLETFNALKILEKEGFVMMSEALSEPSKIMVKGSCDGLIELQNTNLRYAALIDYMLRNLAGVTVDFVKINEETMSHKLLLPVEEIEWQLHDLEKLNYLIYSQRSDKPTITFLTDYAGQNSVILSKENYYDRKNDAMERAKAVETFVNNGAECRSIQLLRYFNETTKKTCGKCDVCLSKTNDKSYVYKDISEKIMSRLKEQPMTYNDAVVECDNYEPSQILNTIRWMVDNNIIKTKDDTMYDA